MGVVVAVYQNRARFCLAGLFAELEQPRANRRREGASSIAHRKGSRPNTV